MKKNKKSSRNNKSKSKTNSSNRQSSCEEPQNIHYHKKKKTAAVIQSYYNCETKINIDVDDAYGHHITRDYSSDHNKKNLKPIQSSLQKVIKRNMMDSEPLPSISQKGKSKKKNQTSQKNSGSKEKKRTTKEYNSFTNSNVLTDTFYDKMNKSKSHSKQSNVRRNRICEKSEKKKRILDFIEDKKHSKQKTQGFNRKRHNRIVDQANQTTKNTNRVKEKGFIYEEIITQKDFIVPPTKISNTQETEGATKIFLERRYQLKGIYIDFISRICAQLFLNRETFELAQKYFMKNMDYFVKDAQKIQTLALACIILALKIDDSMLAKPLFRQILLNPTKRYLIDQNESSHTQQEKKKIVQQQKQTFLKRLMLVKKKFTHRSVEYLKKIHRIFLAYEIQAPHRESLVEMQKFICQQQKFKLACKTLSYSIDYLTFRWDDFLLNTYEEKKYSYLLFRDVCQKKKFSYLIQISDLYILDELEDSYRNIFVLTIMYILVRVQLQSAKKNSQFGLQTIRQSLRQSNNILYVDSVGVNLMFTSFLEEIGFKMESIAQFCSRITKYLEERLFQTYSFDQQKNMNHEESLAIHQHNPKLYRFYNANLYAQ